MQQIARQFDTSTSQNEAADCQRMRVLIIEDNEDQAESLAAVLRLWGFETEVAYDGDTGLDCAICHHPDAILADIGLPGLSGYEIARQLTALPAFRETVMAAVTAYSDPRTVERSREVGFVEHFAKPVDLAALHRFLDDRRETLLRDKH